MRERSFALPADSVPGSAMIPLPLPSDGLRPSNGLRPGAIRHDAAVLDGAVAAIRRGYAHG